MATCVGYQTPSIDKPAERIQEVAIFLVHKTAQCEPNDLCVKACPGCMLSGSEEGVNIFRSGDDFAKALADPLCTLQTPDWQVREYFNQEFSRHRVDGTWEVSRKSVASEESISMWRCPQTRAAVPRWYEYLRNSLAVQASKVGSKNPSAV
ncbi:hypothetical protein CLAFUW4_04099 [Fulvia fulva]|uniref:Uncharacterized protein n=1 Tax=Passalora fulva TaxID=5499 RepID=A0A9Q8LG23_PASFU|nr:uncharacterized protein CLAFUR5_04062 [Fulvia fulva]KAK4626695.1 hypothetical protein CLAFUR4_04085 [Fulvia fulva]KAK4628432.1 hypothetical protein CLAFUR0_04086 [Fulvia fulva]UJO16720.1 hypothetical protein CLAFUR5_04062 [Fulvia fulva]WPV13314.1 hypothetical protein CLAFUW4_04099 [Fulvia fulva]WPV28398.1 hypothetical protein CLAFUW7_04088 [Fulvia fulva]